MLELHAKELTLDTATRNTIVVCTGAAFALGFGLAWVLKPTAPATESPMAALTAPAAASAGTLAPFAAVPARSAQEGAGAVGTLPASAGVDELWTRALAPQGASGAGYDAEDRLRKLAQSDPVARRSLLQRYDSARTPQARELLKSLLSTVQTPDVIAFATRLAGSSNAAERKYGFELLQSVAPEAPETRSLVRHVLATEQSPEVLVQALAALRPGLAEPEETEQAVAQLKTLAQHADPAVRAQSLAQLAQWDKKGESAERLTQALADRVPEVRMAAVFAIAQGGLRTDALKAGLMAVAGNAQESRDLRASALQVLERFALTKDELAAMARTRSQLQAR